MNRQFTILEIAKLAGGISFHGHAFLCCRVEIQGKFTAFVKTHLIVKKSIFFLLAERIIIMERNTVDIWDSI